MFPALPRRIPCRYGLKPFRLGQQLQAIAADVELLERLHLAQLVRQHLHAIVTHGEFLNTDTASTPAHAGKYRTALYTIT